MSNKFQKLEDLDSEEEAFQTNEMFGGGYNPSQQQSSSSPQQQQSPGGNRKIDFEEFNLGNEPAFREPTATIQVQTNNAPINTQSYQPSGRFEPPADPRQGLMEDDQPNKNAKVWHVDYYKYLFNVNTRDVVKRMLRSLTPFPSKFLEKVQENPDLYGPFWIASTLVFILAAVGNVSNWIYHAIHNRADDYKYDVNKMSFAAAAIYGYLGIVPLAVWGACKFFKIPLKLAQILCIYGYAFFIFVPISIMCVIPSHLAHWILVGFATLLSTTFLLFNFFSVFRPHLGPGLLILVVMALLQIGIGLAFQLYFFQYQPFKEDETPATSSTIASTIASAISNTISTIESTTSAVISSTTSAMESSTTTMESTTSSSITPTTTAPI